VTEAFDLDWLDLREPFDALARNEGLAARLLARLPARPRLLDLGSGTGSLFRWLAPRIGRAQAWTLVDADLDMAEAAFDTIADRAESIGLRVTFPSRRCLLVHAPGGAWRVEALVADLADAPGNLPLREADAVVNSALCDLVSRPWVERMAAALRVPFYAALCVDGRDRFAPPHPGDAWVSRNFRRDQRREKNFGGAALGAAAPATLARAFGARGFAVESAASDWVLRARGAPPGLPPDAAAPFLTRLVAGRAEAALAGPHRDGGRVAAWREARGGQIASGALRARIGHRDVLALPQAVAVAAAPRR
jgi:SAM-dependent methyltransferase